MGQNRVGDSTRVCLATDIADSFFGDDIRLVALLNWDEGLRVLTSQPHIAGDAAAYEEIQEWFCKLKFLRLEIDGFIAWYHDSENLLVADAHEGNVIRIPSGQLVPIDLNVIQPSGRLLEWAAAARSDPPR